MHTHTEQSDTVELKTNPELKEKLTSQLVADTPKKITVVEGLVTEVLLVDDDAQHLEEMAELFSGEAYVCHTSTSISEALRTLSSNKNISIVMVDYQMPRLSGLDFIRFIKAGIGKQMDYDYVLVTGHAKKDVLIDAIHMGVVDVIEKPVNAAYAISVMERLREKQALKRKEARHLIAKLEAENRELQENAVDIYERLEAIYNNSTLLPPNEREKIAEILMAARGE